jgi:hypothetical protein
MPAPTTILVQFDRRMPPIRCQSVAEMDAALDRLHTTALDRRAADEQSCPLHVSIDMPGYSINTGLGSADTFVMLGVEPYNEWYTAVGDENAVGDDKMFYGIGDDSYWPPKNLIPVGVAGEAVRYFVENQQRTPALKWEY